jgi:Adenylate and Guanylate cyclase catalytic domain
VSSRALSATGGGALPSTAFLVGAYLDVASAAVVEMGGKVAKKLGDGLMALFGYPVAQENDAERAVQAALAIQRALCELNGKNAVTGKPVLAARIAIDSGPVVLDASGEIFGDVPNIAARAQALAEPGAVVVTARVHARSRVVRRRGARQPRTQRRARTGDAVPAGPSERRRPSLGAAPSHPAGRPRRRRSTSAVRDHQRARGGGPRHPPILGEDDFEGPSRRRGSRMTRPYQPF